MNTTTILNATTETETKEWLLSDIAAPGDMINGELLKKFVNVLDGKFHCFYDGALETDRAEIEGMIEEDDKFAVMVNGNTGNIEFTLLFSATRATVGTNFRYVRPKWEPIEI